MKRQIVLLIWAIGAFWVGCSDTFTRESTAIAMENDDTWYWAPGDTTKKNATFSMYCYWTGEATLGRVEGIRQTRIGHLGGSEIVQVQYDPRLTNLKKMTAALKKQSSFYEVIVSNEKDKKEAVGFVGNSKVRLVASQPRFIKSKYSLRSVHPDLYYLDLTEKQAIELNSWSYFGGRMPDILTAEQKKRWEKLKEKIPSQDPSALRPIRSGDGLIHYREELISWLDE